MLNDLISRDALLDLGHFVPMSKAISDWDELDRNTKIAVLKYAQYVKRLISNAPAVTGEPVVICRDCIYNNLEVSLPGFVYCNLYRYAKDYDGFCDEAERREKCDTK